MDKRQNNSKTLNICNLNKRTGERSERASARLFLVTPTTAATPRSLPLKLPHKIRDIRETFYTRLLRHSFCGVPDSVSIRRRGMPTARARQTACIRKLGRRVRWSLVDTVRCSFVWGRGKNETSVSFQAEFPRPQMKL